MRRSKNGGMLYSDRVALVGGLLAPALAMLLVDTGARDGNGRQTVLLQTLAADARAIAIRHGQTGALMQAGAGVVDLGARRSGHAGKQARLGPVLLAGLAAQVVAILHRRGGALQDGVALGAELENLAAAVVAVDAALLRFAVGAGAVGEGEITGLAAFVRHQGAGNGRSLTMSGARLASRTDCR